MQIRRRSFPVAVVDRVSASKLSMISLCREITGVDGVSIPGTDVVVCYANITPEMATEMLKRNYELNRPWHSRRRGFASDMRARQWRLNHQGIAFDNIGTLYDGQNRLAACVDAGVAFNSLVFVGVPRESMHQIDSGKSRTLSDAAGIAGFEGYGAGPVAVCAAMFHFTPYLYKFTELSPTGKMTVFEIVRDAVEFSWNAFSRTEKSLTRATTRAAIACAYYHESHDDLRAFAASLLSGIYDGNNKIAVFRLREFLMKKLGRGDNADRIEIFGKSQNALFKYCRNIPIDNLYAATHQLYPFPGQVQADLALAFGAGNDQE